MAQHIINDLTLSDGLAYHSITGQSLTEFGKVARYRQLNEVATTIINLSLSEVYDVMCNEYEVDEENLAELGEFVYQFIQDAFGLQPEAYDPDAVDREAVRWKAYELVRQAQLGIEAEDYFRCIACLVWLWRHRRAGSELSFDEFCDTTTFENVETSLTELVVELAGGSLPKDEGDSPLGTASTQT